jgi:hypothetical protein
MSDPSVSAEPGGFSSKGDITVKKLVTNNVSMRDSKGVQVGDGNIQVNNSYYLQGNFEVLSNAVQSHPETYYDFLDLTRFAGRTELMAQVNEFIVKHRHGWVVIQGEAGVGKSALAAQLVSSNGWFYHYTWFTGAKNPENVRKNLAAQLISVFRLDQYVPGGNLPSTAAEPKFLGDVLQEVAAERDKVAPGRPIVLVIDTLSEIDPENQVDTPLGIPSAEELPHKVFVIVTRRPGPPLTSVGEPLLQLSITLDEDRERASDTQLSSTNTRDMHEYLHKLLDGPKLDRELLDVLSAYKFQVSVGDPDIPPLDEYTQAFMAEMHERAAERLAVLHADGDDQAALAACARIRRFFAPYWRAADLPDLPDLHQTDTAYARTATKVLYKMKKELDEPPGTALDIPTETD